jgi:hypothetical protein
VACYYEIPDGNGNVVSCSGGFETEARAQAAGADERARLIATGNAPLTGFGQITVEEDDTDAWQ